MVGQHSGPGIDVRFMDLGKLSQRFEKLSVTARLQDTAYFMRSDEATRIRLVQTVFERLEPPKAQEEAEIRRFSQSLSHGDVIALGASLVNTFLFADLRQ